MSEILDNTQVPRAERADVALTCAFLTALESAYGGMWAFERTLGALEPDSDRADETFRAEQVLERLQAWRVRLAADAPLFALAERPVLDDDASKAWRLLDVAENRMRSLIHELIASSDLNTLAADDFARHVRVAAMVECARAEELRVRGMADWMARLGNSDAAEAWQQRLLACSVQVEEADRWLERFRSLRDEPDHEMLDRFLDDTLLLAATVAERVVAICHTFSLYTGAFEFADVGIPGAQCSAWEEAGFSAYEAGRWFAAGHSPRGARRWIAVGAPDPMTAAGFMWRGFTTTEAAPWLRHHIGGRTALAWASSGHDAEDAREWISLGVPQPQVLDGPAIPERRVM